MTISAGILTGGRSRRMGRDKAELLLNGRTFLQVLIDELRPLDEVLVSVRRPNPYPALPVPVVEDENSDIGPMEGLRRLLQTCRHPLLFVCATDLPLARHELALYLAAFANDDWDCVVPVDEQGLHPLCALYSKRLLPALEAAIHAERYKVTTFIQSVRMLPVPMQHSPFPASMLANINTAEEYHALHRDSGRLRRRPPVVGISGVKNSGKSHLIRRLLPVLRADFPRIGVIKHDGHDFVMDTPGTDTHSFVQTGAVETAIYSGFRSARFSATPPPCVETLIAGMPDVDLILLEGLKTSGYPKIEVVRRGVSQQPVCAAHTLLAVATDCAPSQMNRWEGALLPLADTEKIAQCIKTYARRP